METAFLPIFGNMPQPSERELLDTLDAAQQIYASAGVTTCSEGATHAKDLASRPSPSTPRGSSARRRRRGRSRPASSPTW